MPDQYRGRCRVVGGVDTHRDAHVAAALDPAGRLLGTASFPATRAGYEELGLWLRAWGDVDSVGVEGTSSYGAGVSWFLAAAGVTVVEVLRPGRRGRRGDKNDSADAVAAARSVLSGEAAATPKSADGPVVAIGALRMARRSAVKARTVAMNQIKSLAVTASEQVTAPLRGRSSASPVKACSRLRPDPSGGEAAAGAKRSLRTLATRWQSLSAEIDELDAEITRLCAAAAPALMAAPGVGPQVAAALLVAAGDNPERLKRRSVVRCAVRRQPRRGFLGPNRPPPPQPRRRPPSQQCSVAHRDRPAPQRRAHRNLRRTPSRSGQDRPRDPALPQASHRPGNPPAHRRPARSARRPAPARPARQTRHHPRTSRRRAGSLDTQDLCRRTRPAPRPRPRRTLPTTSRPNRRLTNIGASFARGVARRGSRLDRGDPPESEVLPRVDSGGFLWPLALRVRWC